MKEKINKVYEALKKKWIEKEMGKKFSKILFNLFFISIFLYIVLQIGMIIYENRDFLIMGIGAIVIGTSVITIWWRWLFPQKQPKVETQPVRQNVLKPIRLQQNLLNEFMISLFQSLSVPLHIMKPNQMSDITDKPDMYTDNTTNVTYFRYNVIMNGEAIEENLFREILRQGIEKGLPTARLGNPISECNGKQYPKVAIDDVKFSGASWRVVVVIVDEDYARVLENKAQRQQYTEQKEEITFYEDGDFS